MAAASSCAPNAGGLELWGAVGVLPYRPLAPVSSPDVQSGPWAVDRVAAWTANVLRVRGEGCALGSCVCVHGLWDTDSSRRVRPLPLPSALGQPCCPGSVDPGLPQTWLPASLSARARPPPRMPHPHALTQSLWLSTLNKLGSFPSLPTCVRRWPGGDTGEPIQGCCWW